MNNSRDIVIKSIASIIIFTYFFPAFAQESGIDDSSIRCITISRIRDIEILDSSNIIFRVDVNTNYLNTLPYQCSGLGRNDTIMFRTSLDELCDVDVITILEDIGPGFQAGVSCGLGRFTPVNQEEIRMLRELIREGR